MFLLIQYIGFSKNDINNNFKYDYFFIVNRDIILFDRVTKILSK